MPIEVILPKVDMDMETGVIIEWKVVAGAHVRKGDILFDLETNKAVMEVESPGSGIIRQLAPITGEPIAVGTVVGWIDVDAESRGIVSRSRGATRTRPPSAATAEFDHATSLPGACPWKPRASRRRTRIRAPRRSPPRGSHARRESCRRLPGPGRPVASSKGRRRPRRSGQGAPREHRSPCPVQSGPPHRRAAPYRKRTKRAALLPLRRSR
jgi:pyruvate dehydrogenase E2 component (dihydrolipoamide acetyltransferase)